MEHIQATPFGRSSMPAGQLSAAAKVRSCSPGAVANRRDLWQNLATAREQLGLAHGTLAVLQALMSCLLGDVLTSGTDFIIYRSSSSAILLSSFAASAFWPVLM